MPHRSPTTAALLWFLLLARLNAHPLRTAVAVAICVLCVGAWLGSRNPLDTRTWANWDSGHYEFIANNGYSLEKCPPTQPNRHPDDWCGEAAWAPALPAVMRVTGWVSIPPRTAALVLSWSSWIVTMLLCTRLLPADVSPGRRTLLLVLAAIFPGIAWTLGVFPIALCVLCSVVAGLLLAREHALLAGAAGAGAIAAHSGGPILCFGLGCAALLLDGSFRTRVARAARFAVGPALYLAAEAAYFQVRLGHWNANLLIEEEYGNGISWPWTTVIKRFTTRGFSNPAARWQTHWPPLQEGVVLVIVFLAAGLLLWQRHRGIDEPVVRASFVLAVMGVITYLMLAVVSSGASYWRAAAVSMPATLALRRLPAVPLFVVVAAVIVVDLGVTSAFVQVRLP